MRNFFFAGLFLILVLPASAQVGITTTYRLNDAADWLLQPISGSASQTELLGNGVSLGVDYWFRLKNTRIEFLPEINYASFNQFQLNGSSIDRSNEMYSFFFNTNIYLLDLVNDCNCPTFSKQNDLVKKGFFVQISPGFSYGVHDLSSEERVVELNSSAFSVGLGLGLDVGVSNILTITPLAGFRYFFAANLEGVDGTEQPLIENLQLNDPTSSITQFYIGARLGLRFDKKNY